MNTPTHSVGML